MDVDKEVAMAVLITGEVPGMTVEQYDKVNETMGVSTAADIDGLICHTAGSTVGGMYISDVWESQEAFDRFIQERLMPAFQEVGITAQGPEPKIVQVHNHLHD
jgi:hypothetical protein